MGCSEERFWTLNPRKIKVIYVKKQEIQNKQLDHIAWLHGMYVHAAMSVVMANAFSKKGAKPVEYPDKPLLDREPDETIVVSEEMSQEEKDKHVNMLFDQLHIMQANFELYHGNKEVENGD